MSKISSAYDGLNARLAVLLPSHFRLTNPYQLEQNSENTLIKGYGVRVAGGENSHRNLSCVLSVKRTFEIAITRKIFAGEFGLVKKEDAWKALLEDQFLVIKDLEKQPTLALADVVANSGFENDSGVVPVFAEDKPFFAVVSQFVVEYLENLN